VKVLKRRAKSEKHQAREVKKANLEMLEDVAS
jgi:hypothetical protein